MVTRYDVISSRWSSQFWVNNVSLQLLSTIKVNLVAKIIQSAYLCVIFQKKFLAVLTWFLIFGKIQDGDHCWLRHRPPAAPTAIKYLVKKIKGFSIKVKSFQNTSTHQKLRGGVSLTPPSPPRTAVRVWICVDVRGLIFGDILTVFNFTCVKNDRLRKMIDFLMYCLLAFSY